MPWAPASPHKSGSRDGALLLAAVGRPLLACAAGRAREHAAGGELPRDSLTLPCQKMKLQGRSTLLACSSSSISGTPLGLMEQGCREVELHEGASLVRSPAREA